jgi:hypothetical protein
MTTFKIVFTSDVFLVLKPHALQGDLYFIYIVRNRQISVSSFVYKYDQWSHDSHMTGRAGVWEADDIVQFYIVAKLQWINNILIRHAGPKYRREIRCTLVLHFICKR